MTNATQTVEARYDRAAPAWGDKMRTLGYYDGYLGFLSAPAERINGDVSVIDVGAGTASFAEAWVAVYGSPRELTLLDPSAAMLERGSAALGRRGVPVRQFRANLGEAQIPPADVVLAGHVIEHCGDPLEALRDMRDLLREGGRLHLVVSKPHWCNAIIWFQWRHRTFREAEILELMGQAGFHIERLYAFPSGPPSRTSRGIVATKIG